MKKERNDARTTVAECDVHDDKAVPPDANAEREVHDDVMEAGLAEARRMTKVEWQLRGLTIETKRDILDAYRRAKLVYSDQGLKPSPLIRATIALQFIETHQRKSGAKTAFPIGRFVDSVIAAFEEGRVLTAEDVGLSLPRPLDMSQKKQFDSILINQQQANHVARHIVRANTCRRPDIDDETDYERGLLRPMFAVLQTFSGEDWLFDSESQRNLVAYTVCVRALAHALKVTPEDVQDRVAYQGNKEANDEDLFKYRIGNSDFFDEDDIPF